MKSILVIVLFLSFYSVTYTQTVDFTYQSSSVLFCTPSVIQFTQTATGNPVDFIWDFGNGQKAYTANATTTYTNSGSYTVKLIAIYNDITLETFKTITINPVIKAVIAVDRDYICLPGVINFSGSGNGSISNYQWNFGDGSAITDVVSPATSHNFASLGTYTVTLRATDVSGCYGDTNIVVSVKNPLVTATATPSRGCAPADVTFTGTVDLPLNSSVTSYSWNFRDGSPISLTTANTISHTFQIGVYSPRLTITTNEGCTGTYDIPTISYGIPPATTFAYPKKPTICGSDSALFVAKGTNANRYFWNFGDGTTLSTSDTIVAHKYKTLGYKSVGVTAYYNGCPGVFTRANVTVIGVIAQYSSTNSCNDRNTYSFLNTSQGNVSGSLWNFGDGFQQSNTNNPVHPYPSPGQFVPSLLVNDIITGCADTTYGMISTTVPSLNSTSLSVCKNDSVTFSISNNYTDTTLTYSWNLLGSQIGPDSNSIITIKANSVGFFDNFVVINRGPQFCLDTIRMVNAVVVKGPDLAFDVPASICFNNPVVVTNNSQPFVASDSIDTWYWNYGNGPQNDSVYQPAPFQYATPGSYDIMLKAVDKNGCSDSLIKSIIVNPSPFLRIIPKTSSICAGQAVSLIAFNNENVVWSPGNRLSCINCDTTIATPQVSTKYFATSTNMFNCTVIDSAFIEVNAPSTPAPSSGSVSICTNETVVLDALPKGKKILWSPATGLSDPTIYNPVVIPTQSITYTATLTDSAGCFTDTTAFSVHVKPSPVVDAGPDKFYPKGTGFTFAPTYSNNVATYLWTPSASLSCTNCAVPGGVASSTQKYIVAVTSDSGCVASDSVTINIECKSSELYMPKAFTPNNDNLNDFYYPLTKSFKSIAVFTIYNRQGKVVFTGRNLPPNDPSSGWDGRFKGAFQGTGTYVYTLEAICEIGEKVVIKGSFILIR